MKTILIKKTFLVFLLVIWTISVSVNAQQLTAQTFTITKKPGTITAYAHQLDSKLMARKVPYYVLLPENYDNDKLARFPVIYLLHGLSGNYKDWVEKTKLLEFAARHKMIIITVEGGNGWYTDSVTKPDDRYESYIIQELIPEVDKNFRTIATRRGRAVGGLSMGGYGALKFGLKYPDKFVFAASMSGAVSIASLRTSEKIPPMFRQMILSTFGDENNSVKKANDLFVIFGELTPEMVARLPFFYLDCGTEDELGLLQFNQQLAGIMLNKKIPHEFRELPGKHNWDLWGQQVQDVLRISERIFNAQATVNLAAAN
ncbi:MAG: alpha/beta hydrolase family protein [Pyrinomonadaceae bacterium]